MANPRFTRTVWLLGLVSLFADISSELLYPVLPVYLKQAGYSMLALGLLEGIANVIAGISKGYFGHQSDLLQRRMLFVRWGYGLSALGKMIMTGHPGLLRIYLARACDRFGKGVRTAPRDALLSLEAGKHNRAAVFGFHRGLDTLGAAIGPALALWWLSLHPGDYNSLFLMACFPALISLLVAGLVKEKHPPEAARVQRKYTGFFSYFRYWKKSPAAFRALLLPLLLLALVNSPDVFLLLALKEAGFSDLYMIVVYIVYNLLYALLSTPAGMLADRLGKVNVLLAGLLLFILTYAGMAAFSGLSYFVMLFAVYAASMACLEGVAKALISDITPPDERGQAIGFYTSTGSIGVLVAGLWTGFLWPIGGPALVFSVTAGTAGIALLILLSRKRKIKTL